MGETSPFKNHYTLGKQLGQPGQFGVAHLCTHVSDGAVRAVKIISKARMVGQHKQYYMTAMQNEIDILQRLSKVSNAPNVIKFHEVLFLLVSMFQCVESHYLQVTFVCVVFSFSKT